MRTVRKTEVRALFDRLTAAWNRHDLVGVCECYAEDASFVSKSGHARGRENLLARYQRGYPDAAAMGTLFLKPVEFRFAKSMCSMILVWEHITQSGEKKSGYSSVVLEIRENHLVITQDTSVAT